MQSQNRENYIVVNILDLDPKKIKFGEEEKSEHGGFYIPIFYDEKTLFVKYGKRTCPFGIRSGHFLSQQSGMSIAGSVQLSGQPSSIPVYRARYVNRLR